MKIIRILICIIPLIFMFQTSSIAQSKRVKKAISKSINMAMDKSAKPDRFYLAKFSQNKCVTYDELVKYCQGKFILHEIKFNKAICFGNIKKMVITNFKVRRVEEAIREESSILKKILATERY